MIVSIIIRTKNEAASLGKVLEAIAGQAVDFDVEVVVVDSGSSDSTVAVARQHGCKVVEIPPEEFSWGRALNIGIRAGKGDILVNLSAHCDPVGNGWLSTLTRRLHAPTVAGVYGRQLPRRGQDPMEEVELDMWFPAEESQLSSPGFSNANSAIRRDVWEQYPFNEDLLSCEDGEWALRVRRAGYRIEYEPAGAVYHSHPLQMKNVYLRWYWRSFAWKGLSGSTREGRILYAVYQTAKFALKDIGYLVRSNYWLYLPAVPVYEGVRQYARLRGAVDYTRREVVEGGFAWFKPEVPALVRLAGAILDKPRQPSRRRSPSRLVRRLWNRVYQRQVKMYFSAAVIFDNIKNAPPLAPGYRVRPLRPEDDLKAWAELLNEDGELGYWTADRIREEIVSSLITPDAATMLFYGDELVGCANAVDYPGQEGRIGLGMYMYLSRHHRGRRGLGYILSFYTLNFFVREAYEGAIATTDPSRLAALAIYLHNGCTPRRDSLISYFQWLRIRRRLDPVLEKMRRREARLRASSSRIGFGDECRR
jgi:rhamnosyltransferase